MDWNSLTESATALWALVGATVVNFGGTAITMLKTIFSGNKFKNVSEFAVIAKNSFVEVKGEIKDLKAQIVSEVKEQIVSPLLNEIKALQSDNAKLANLVVGAISLTNVPLEQKKALLPVLSSISTISAETIRLLQANIAYQEKIAISTSTQTESTTQNILEI